jgi:nucleotide-binding universal stress UspA family protein
VASGPVVIAYDGGPNGEQAIREAAALLEPREAVVVTVWKEGLGFELLELPTATVGLPPAPIDIRTALEIDQANQERAQAIAQRGAGIAREAGFEAVGLAVADEPEVPVPETIVRVATERDARAIVAGTHGHGGRLSEIVLGGTTRDILRHAPCPVLVVRGSAR